MVRELRTIAASAVASAAAPLALAALAAACSSELPPPAMSAQQLFETRAWPAFVRCIGCHATRPSIDFLAPGVASEAYPTLFVYQPQIIDVASPASSLVLTMGKHTGPELLPAEAEAVMAWLEAEHAERVPPPALATTIGPVPLTLDAPAAIGLGFGATLRFTPTQAATGIALRQITVTAGAAGLHVVHPLFATHPALVPLRIDRSDALGDVDQELAPDATEPLGGGSAVLPDFDPADPITIHFRTLEAP
jgi:mono/diheme cytochrome c family protein